MPIKYFKSFNTGSIADGAYKEVTWTPETDVHIKYLLVSEQGGAALRKATMYMTIAGEVITKDFVTLHTLGDQRNVALDLDIDVAKGAKIYIKITNNTGSAINCDLTFVVTA